MSSIPAPTPTPMGTDVVKTAGQRWTVTPRRRLWNSTFKYLCLLSLLFATVLLLVLLYTLGKNGFKELNADLFTHFTSFRPSKAGIKAALVGSLYIVIISSLFAVPIGVASAVYLEEFTVRKTRFTNFLQLNIANLAGVPSIIYGLLGLAVFVRAMALDKSVIAGALTMALLSLPTIILVSQEALRAVPKSVRDASIALGCSRWQTIRHHVLPIAMPGIITGIILSVSRALGETAPLITIGAVKFIAFLPDSLGSKFTVLPVQIFDWTSRPQAAFQDKAASAIVVLLGMLLLLNSIAIVLRIRAKKHF